MSIRLANQLQLTYDANSQRIWAIAPIQNSLVVHHRILLPAQSTGIISTKFQGSWDPKATYVATLHNLRTGFVVGGPALVHIKDDQTCQVAVINTAPFDIQLERDNFIGAIETLPTTPVRPIDALPVASITQPPERPFQPSPSALVHPSQKPYRIQIARPSPSSLGRTSLPEARENPVGPWSTTRGETKSMPLF